MYKKLKLSALSLSFLAVGFAAQAASTPLVSAEWLNANKDKVAIIDIRSKIGLKKGENYAAGHIPGAVEADYLKAGWRGKRGDVVGVLPQTDKIVGLVEKVGINNDSHVVIVSAGNNATDFGSAARVYWTLKYLGHEDVSILNGGQKAWSDAKLPLETKVNLPAKGTFVPTINAKLNIDGGEVLSYAQKGGAQLLDGRPQAQFLGKEKHGKALKFGRIPNSTNLFNHQFFAKGSAQLLASEELAKVAKNISTDEPIISYCNTGHWAATNWFVLSEVLGHKNVRMYDGSMVEWTANASYPIQSDRTRLDDLKASWNKFWN